MLKLIMIMTLSIIVTSCNSEEAANSDKINNNSEANTTSLSCSSNEVEQGTELYALCINSNKFIIQHSGQANTNCTDTCCETLPSIQSICSKNGLDRALISRIKRTNTANQYSYGQFVFHMDNKILDELL